MAESSRQLSSDEVVVVEASLIIIIVDEIVNLDLVSQETTNAAKAFAELVSVGGLVRDKLDSDAELLVVKQKPIGQILT